MSPTPQFPFLSPISRLSPIVSPVRTAIYSDEPSYYPSATQYPTFSLEPTFSHRAWYPTASPIPTYYYYSLPPYYYVTTLPPESSNDSNDNTKLLRIILITFGVFVVVMIIYCLGRCAVIAFISLPYRNDDGRFSLKQDMAINFLLFRPVIWQMIVIRRCGIGTDGNHQRLTSRHRLQPVLSGMPM
jgi:hypothetical protein